MSPDAGGDAGDKVKKGCVGGYVECVLTNAYDFLNFLYDHQTGRVMGRNFQGWVQLLVFYTFYYAFLAGLFALSIVILMGSLDEFKPFFNSRLQYPGVTILPRTYKFNPTSLDIIYNPTIPNSYQPYVDEITNFLDNYKGANPANNLVACLPNEKPYTSQIPFTANTIAQACSFDKTKFLPDCQNPPYGYNTNTPCIFFKLNKIIDWEPVPFKSLNDELATGGDTGAISLKQYLTDTGLTYTKSLTYVTCNPKEASEQATWTTALHAPAGLENQYFPYLGLKRQPNYIPPMVSVQFQGLQVDKQYNMVCKVYARNMVDYARINVGFVEFLLKVEGP